MSEKTIVLEVGKDLGLRLTPEDAAFIGVKPGQRLVLVVNRSENVPGLGMHARLSVAAGGEAEQGGGRKPRAFG